MTRSTARFTLLLVVLSGLTYLPAPAWGARGKPTGEGEPPEKAEGEEPAEKPAEQGDEGKEPAGEQGEGENGPVGNGQEGPRQFPWMMVLLLGGLVLLFVFMGRKPRKEEKKRQEMLANLKKGDKVTSIGGIVGTIAEVRDHEVTVKVDESANARMKFAKWAIRSVGTPHEQAKEQESKK